jgi:serine/threonine-protein kinase
MSPEEASGSHNVDGRADVYALGCVLYEMLSGGPPFVGTPKAVIAQRLHGTPPPVTRSRSGIPRAVSQAITKAMATRPENRFKTAGEFAEALEGALRSGSWLAVGPPSLPKRAALMLGVALLLAVVGFMAWHHRQLTPAKAIAAAPVNLAVLPFANAGRPEDEHFASGITDEIRGRLARLPGLQVIASTSTARFRDSTQLKMSAAGWALDIS